VKWELRAWLPSELSGEMLDVANRCQLNLSQSYLNLNQRVTRTGEAKNLSAHQCTVWFLHARLGTRQAACGAKEADLIRA